MASSMKNVTFLFVAMHVISLVLAQPKEKTKGVEVEGNPATLISARQMDVSYDEYEDNGPDVIPGEPAKPRGGPKNGAASGKFDQIPDFSSESH
uniref:Chimadanin n=1 Tax=Haemaphysalis longicornis TaxID=44386 RepID=Q4R1A0_HAELO|nr:chimadanin [Haemaphysalis longicornis]